MESTYIGEEGNRAARRFHRYSVLKHDIVTELDDWAHDEEQRSALPWGGGIQREWGANGERLPGILMAIFVFAFLLTVLASAGIGIVRQSSPPARVAATAR